MFLQIENIVPDVDPVGPKDARRLFDATPINIGSIGAIEIGHLKLIVFVFQLCVTFGDIPAGEDDLIALNSSNGDRLFVKVQSLTRPSLFGDDDCEHPGKLLSF